MAYRWLTLGLICLVGCGEDGKGTVMPADAAADTSSVGAEGGSPDAGPADAAEVGATAAPSDGPAAETAPGPSLTLDRASADFGGATRGCDNGATITFRVTNAGSGTTGALVIALSSSHFVTSAPCQGRELAAGQSCDIAVQFRPQVEGQLSGTLTVSATPGGLRTANLSGLSIVGDSLSTEGGILDFGQVDVNTASPAMTVSLRNVGGMRLPISSTTLAAGDFTISSDGCVGKMLAPGEACSISVVFKPTSLGAKTNVLIVKAGGCTGNSVAYTVIGWGVGLGIDRSEFDFGTGPPGGCKESPRVTLTVRNDSSVASGPLMVTAPAGFVVQNDACSGKSLASQASCKLDVVFIPMLEAPVAGQLQVLATPGGSVQVSLKGVGVHSDGLSTFPTSNPSAGLHDFGMASVGTQTAGVKFTVKNSSRCTVENVTWALTGPNINQFVLMAQTCPSLAPGASCEATVSFAPTTTAKVHTASLTATAAGITGSVVLKGEGI